MLQDLRYAVRSFFRQPSFAITAIVTLALGIGATTAIFSVVNAVILRPMPFDDADRIVAITNYWTRTGTRSQNVSAPDFYDWKAQSGSFDAMAYYIGGEWSVTIKGAADYAQAFRVTPGFFETLRARAALGRLFTDEEQRAGGPLAVVITDAFWKERFNEDPGALGTTIKFGDRFFTIVGVLPRQLRFPARADFYFPAWLDEETGRTAHNYRAIGRLREGVTLEQARSELTAIAKRLEQTYPNSNEGKLIALLPLQELLVQNTRMTLYILLGAVGVVLLIACANVANLLLARASNRRREMVVRAAVGAGRGRLVRQLLTESAVLAMAAGIGGAWLARLGVRAFVASAPAVLPRLDEVQVDLTALGFALGVALVASFVFGLAPAIHLSRVQLVEGLRQGGKGTSTGARAGWARNAFVVAEVALAVVLVVSAGLLGRSLVKLTTVDLGFESDRLLVLATMVPVQTMEQARGATTFYRELLADLRTTAGIQAIAGVTSLPTKVRSNGAYFIEGDTRPAQTVVRAPSALFNVITPQYFRTVGVPVRQGRDFMDGDRFDAPFVAIINEALARAAFPGQDPLGRRIQCGLDSLEFMTIVGVVGDMRTEGPASPPEPEIYMPFEQHPGPAIALNLVARTQTADPLALAETIRRKIRSLNPDVPVKATTMEETLDTASATPRFRTVLLVVFASIALLLAVAGVYGVMAYAVSQRIPELGVRIALGATPENIVRLVVAQGAALAGGGLVLGLFLALLSGRALKGLLFGVTPRDPLILVAVPAVIAAAMLAACYIPARRAVRVDPVVALRAE